MELNQRALETAIKKTLGMPKKNALIDHSMTSDRAGLNIELYGLNFAHCELSSKSICAHCVHDQTAFKFIDLQQQIITD